LAKVFFEGERPEHPFPDGERLTRHCVRRSVLRLPGKAGALTARYARTRCRRAGKGWRAIGRSLWRSPRSQDAKICTAEIEMTAG